MTREEYLIIYRSAKIIRRLSDYLFTTNKLRGDQIAAEAERIIYLVNCEIGQISPDDE